MSGTITFRTARQLRLAYGVLSKAEELPGARRDLFVLYAHRFSSYVAPRAGHGTVRGVTYPLHFSSKGNFG